jgi:hypothetical protein
MISIKPVSQNDPFPIRANVELESNVTEESDLHSEKHQSLTTATPLGMTKNCKSLLPHGNNLICDNVDAFSNATDLMCRMHSDAIDSIPEGSQSLVPKK